MKPVTHPGHGHSAIHPAGGRITIGIGLPLCRTTYQQGLYPAWGKIEWTQVISTGSARMYSTLPFFCATA